MSTRTAQIVRQRRRRRRQKSGDARTILRWLLGLSLLMLALLLTGAFSVLGVGVGTYLHYAAKLPPPSEIEAAQDRAFQTTILYDRTGQQVIYEVVPPLGGDRQRVSVYDVPDYFLQATVSIEDASYYSNPGFDIRGISRALWTNFIGGDIQGGSTITQQLVKNVLIAEEERSDLSVDRKVSEIILASEISRLYSKDQILEWYINTNFYGNLAYGIEAAARVYFNKSARDLTLAEAAMLAAIPQFPLQNPIDNPEAARLRQELVLDRMVRQGYISAEEAETALAEPLQIRQFDERFDIRAPHFALYARNEAESILNEQGLDGAYLISRGGLRIYTTVDMSIQEQVECVSASYVGRLRDGNPDYTQPTASGQPCTAAMQLPTVPEDLQGQNQPVSNAAGVVIRAETGEILAMSGSVDFWSQDIDGNFNVATALRQPGSAFKPFVYLAAFFEPLDNGGIVTAATMTSDAPIEFYNGGPEPYVPVNIDREYHGPVSVREALANSYNVPAVQVLNWVGLSPVVRMARRLGINSLNESLDSYGLALALGSEEVSLLDITYAYNVLNRGGYAVGRPVHASRARPGYRQLDPTSILRIEDANGEILWEYSSALGTFDRRFILEPGMAYIMTDILADNEARWREFPPGNPLELSRPAAVKTGTTNENRDSWTVGYTPQYTVGVWVGNNDNRSMNDITGTTGAAPIWHAVMEYVHADLPVETWERPTTVIEQTVCQWSGLLPTENCPQVPRELFYYDPVNGVDYRPQQADDRWYTLPVDICNNTRANDTTPLQCVDNRIFFSFPLELQTWAQENTPDLLPPQAEGVVREPSQFSPGAIVSPRLTQVSGTVEVFGNTNLEGMVSYQLGYGVGNEPSTFVEVASGTQNGFNIALGTWETTALDDGVYTLRLQIVLEDNRVNSSSTRVTVDNTPPEIRLSEPQPGRAYSADIDVVINLQAEVFDGGGVGRVEFYINPLPETDAEDLINGGILLGESTAFPYTLPWIIEADNGTDRVRTFWAIAYDRAGNRTESERVTITTESASP